MVAEELDKILPSVGKIERRSREEEEGSLSIVQGGFWLEKTRCVEWWWQKEKGDLRGGGNHLTPGENRGRVQNWKCKED